MRKPTYVTLALLLPAMASARAADAQTAWSDRARVSINVGVQPSASMFSETTNVPVYEQTSTLTTPYNVPSGPFFDGGVIVRVSGGFGIDVGVSSFVRSQTATTTGSIPHPLVFNRPRPISGTTPPLERTEIAGHIDASYVLSTGLVEFAVSAGPAFFTVSQDLIANVTYADAPPYDTVAFTGVVVNNAMATALGVNASVDVGLRLSKFVGVGAIVRYSRASVTFPLANTASGVHADVGGTQAGGGLRFHF